MKHQAIILSAELSRLRRERYSRWFAYFAVGFALIVFVAIPAGRAGALRAEPQASQAKPLIAIAGESA